MPSAGFEPTISAGLARVASGTGQDRYINVAVGKFCSSIILLLLVFSPWAGLAGTRAQSGDRYGCGTLHSRQVLSGSFPLLSLAFRRSHSRRQMPPSPQQRERS
jgi:hypothetical protein